MLFWRLLRGAISIVSPLHLSGCGAKIAATSLLSALLKIDFMELRLLKCDIETWNCTLDLDNGLRLTLYSGSSFSSFKEELRPQSLP